SLVAALCVEYDALPGIGRGSCRNLIAGASLRAALALAAPAPELDPSLQVIGTPAEAHRGGVPLLIARGAFDGVRLSLVCQPTRPRAPRWPPACCASGSGTASASPWCRSSPGSPTSSLTPR